MIMLLSFLMMVTNAFIKIESLNIHVQPIENVQANIPVWVDTCIYKNKLDFLKKEQSYLIGEMIVPLSNFKTDSIRVNSSPMHS